ncbi:type II secretion system F family protein [Candidatus Acetatifactor stercoripullorum]|nr:type II secretion system F family protein [Candidatus Acetatifactor stercoripullorum]
MIGAVAVIFVIYAVLAFLSRKEDCCGVESVVLKPFARMAVYLYKNACIRRLPLFRSDQVEADVRRLYPGECGQQSQTWYYVEKLSLSLALVFVGTAFAFLIDCREKSSLALTKTGIVERTKEERTLYLTAVIDSEEEEAYKNAFTLQVAPQRLTEEELASCYEEFVEKLPELILGDNPSLDQVWRDLELLQEYEGFPFSLEWSTDKPEVLGASGRIYDNQKTGEVLLAAEISYGERKWQENVTVCVTPPVLTAQERIYEELEALLSAAEQDSRMEKEWALPAAVEGKEVKWEQAAENKGIILWIMALAAAGAVYFLKDRDLHERIEKRKRRMKREYPDIVHKLALYLGAGMTVRGAFQKVAKEAERGRGAKEAVGPAYEEMLHACREMQAGVSEGAAYASFGKRTGIQEYMRLSTLLMQNLKKGNSTLLERLAEEADKAGEEQLQSVRQLGEEAGTKLLLPMVMLLFVVMIMVMLPAFSSMGVV